MNTRELNARERVGRVLFDLQGTADAPGRIGELGLVVEDVTVTPAGRRRLVRIWLDRDLAGLDPDDETSLVEPLSLDEVAEATRVISAALDASDVMGEAPYVLEVGSAGVDRPLTTARHFRRNVTRLVEISPAKGLAQREGAAAAPGSHLTRLTGRLVAAGPTGATVLLPASNHAPASEIRIPYDEIARAQVQVEFAHVITEEES